MHSSSHPEEGTTRSLWADKLIRDSRDKHHSGVLVSGANNHHPNALVNHVPSTSLLVITCE